MRQLAIPACYYPTTVLFVDDNLSYLNLISASLDVSKFSFKLLSDPMQTLELLRKYRPNLFTQRCIERPEENQYDHRNIDIVVSKIWHEAYNPQRFSEISVIVVDYAMPGLNGVDFASECRLLKSSPFKILLLTGEAGTDKAVAAFNDKVIDKFIRKDAPDFKEVLNNAICELQKEYFLDLSRLVMDSLTKNPEHPIVTWLDEPVFFKLFDEICKKNKVTEYYLSDVLGSFMFLDFEGKPSWLAVKNGEEMQTTYEVAESSVAQFPSEVLRTMQLYEKILYLHGRAISVSDDPQEVQEALHPATELQGNKAKYYYAYINDSSAYKVDRNMILSYETYRNAVKDL